MKKLISVLLAFIYISVLFYASPIRIARGEIVSHNYIKDIGYTSTFITTTDGEDWIAEGYMAPIGDDVFVVYDKYDNTTIYDDEIIYIIHLTKFK